MSDESKSRVLIVDDELLNLKILSNILENDVELSAATNGEQALEVAKRQPPDIILLDLVMPKMHGLDVCKALKEDANLARIPVIFVTSMDDETNEALGLEAGACDYIAKPVSPAIVLARIRIHLQNRMYEEFLETLLSEKNQLLEQVREQAQKLKDSI